MVMNCRGCGRPISDDSVFCQYCGYSITGIGRPAQQGVQAKKGMSTGTIVAIVVIVIVIIPIVLSAILYVMVLGFGGTSSQTPTTSLSKESVTSGWKFKFTSVSVATQWSDVTIQLSDGWNTVQWAPATTDLDDGTTTKCNEGPKTLGSLTVFCNITDLTGNGYVNQGDFIVLTTDGATPFSYTTTYTVTIMHDPTAAEMCDMDFQG